MTVPAQPGMQCSEFEALLPEAAEGTLATQPMQSFRAHAAGCAVCAAMFAEALSGYKWLESLQEVEPPVHLVHNILAATSGLEVAEIKAQAAARKSWLEQLRERWVPALRPLLQPRIAGSFAMAIFSISVLLNLAGVKVSDLKHADLRPSAIRSELSRTYYDTTAKVERYYDSMRFVYELQARVRELKEVATPEQSNQQQPPQQQQREKKDKKNKGMSDGPSPRENNREQYSRVKASVIEAAYQQPRSVFSKTPPHPVILSEAFHAERRTPKMVETSMQLQGILPRISRGNALPLSSQRAMTGDPSTRASALAQDDMHYKNSVTYEQKNRSISKILFPSVILSQAFHAERRTPKIIEAQMQLQGVLPRISRGNALPLSSQRAMTGDPSTRASALAQDDMHYKSTRYKSLTYRPSMQPRRDA